jgi:hypothetical protein
MIIQLKKFVEYDEKKYTVSKYNSHENRISIIDVYKEMFVIITITCINNKKNI